VDICAGGTSTSSSSSGTDHSQECYNSGFSSAVGNLVGQDPDAFVATYGVAPLDISSYLVSGQQQIQFDLVNLGDYLASSSLYLNTNCTQTGVSGQVNFTGNTISQTNITQNYPIDSTSNQKFQFVYDLSKAQQAGSLSITSGTVPYITDIPVDPTTFQTTLVPNTSFATSSCLIHTGELLNGLPSCTLYTLECTSGTSGLPLEEMAAKLNHVQESDGAETRRRYVTAIFAQLNPAEHTLDVVNAGHNPGFLVHGKDVQEIGASGTPVGMLPGMTYTSMRYHLEQNSRFLLYTDGLTEVFRGEEEFGSERLLEEVRSWRGTQAEQLLNSVWSAVESFDGEVELTDDRTALALLRVQ